MTVRNFILVFMGLSLAPLTICAQENRIRDAEGNPGQFTAACTVGWDGLSSPIGTVISGELSAAAFSLGAIKTWLGVMACCSEYYKVDSAFAAGGMLTLHIELPLACNAYAGFGPDVEFTAPRWGFVQTAGLVHMLNKQLGIQMQEHYIKNIGSSGIILCGIGAVAQLH